MEGTATLKKHLYIKPSKILPEVDFQPSGQMSLKGRILTDHICDFINPLFTWVEHCACSEVQLSVELDYLNSNGTFSLAELLRRLEANEQVKSIYVIWFYEEEDEEHYELGDLIRSKLKRSDFEFISYN